MLALLEAARGYRTYAIAVCTIIFALYGVYLHVISGGQAGTMISTSLMAMGLRSSISHAVESMFDMLISQQEQIVQVRDSSTDKPASPTV